MAAEPRRSSIEIVAQGAMLRNALNEKKSTKSAAESRTDDAKRELEMIEHQVPLDELWTLMGCPADTWTESKSNGLSEATAGQFLARDGPNRLTPPSTEPLPRHRARRRDHDRRLRILPEPQGLRPHQRAKGR